MSTKSATGTPSVLFVCIHNAGRSQMAAGWLAALAGNSIEVRSAGTAPADHVNPAGAAAIPAHSFPAPTTSTGRWTTPPGKASRPSARSATPSRRRSSS